MALNNQAIAPAGIEIIHRPSLVWLVVGGSAAALLLIITVALTIVNIRQLNNDAAWVAHTYQVIAGLENILSLARDAETELLSFITTADSRYLEPYNQANNAINRKVDEVQFLTSDNARQQARFPQLRDRVAARLRTLDEINGLSKGRISDSVRQANLYKQGKNDLEALQAVINEMTGHERDLLRDRAGKTAQTYQVAILTTILSGLTTMVAVGAFLILLGRHLKGRTKNAAIITEQAEKLRTTLSSIGDAVIATDAEGRVTIMNAVAESLTGWKIDDAAGRPLEDAFNIVNESSRLPVESPITKALREGVIVGLANHTVLIAKDGTERPIDDSAAPIRFQNGAIIGCVLVFRDITGRKQAEDQLRELAANLSEADRRKNEFLAMLAHELRNPLAPIRNALQIVRISDSNRETVKFASDIMDRQVNHMVRLVDDLLDVSRVSQGKIELRRERVELAQILRNAVESIRPAIDQARNELSVTQPPKPVFLYADSTRLEQVFANLLSNACKYGKHGGRISLAAELRNDRIEISVKDHGVGIRPDMLKKIFEMFVQADQSLERSQGGLGIGLTLVQRLVEMHEGSVTAFSDGPDRGSEFVVSLPILEETNASPETLSQEPASSPVRRYLVVDDNRDSAESLAMWLKLTGNETQMAFDGLEAVETAATFRPDVALLDIGLPKLNGYEVARRIREQPWGKNIVLVALTGWGQEEDRRKTNAAGFNGHLVKPVDFDYLMKLLAELTDADAPAKQKI